MIPAHGGLRFAFEEVGEAVGLEDFAGSVADTFPDFALGTVMRMVGIFDRFIEPGDGGQGTFEDFDDVADGESGRVTDEFVATGRSAYGADEASLPHDGEELVQVLLGNMAADGDLG